MSKAIAALNRQIAADNRAFARMTPAQKRVTIARDVLSQLQARRITAESGTYLRTKNRVVVKKKDEGDDLGKLTRQIKTCNACAVGSLFLCAVERADKLKLGSADDDAAMARRGPLESSFNDLDLDLHRYLGKFFSAEQLAAIEGAFENGSVGGAACRMLEVVEDDGDRLRLIMENISRNRGRFDPEDPRMFSGEIG